MDEVISVENLTKKYKMYSTPKDRVKEVLGFGTRKYYEEYFALDNVSFGVKRGEIVGIVGRNGSGKSTLLKILTGVLDQSIGEVSIKGKVSALLELGAGFNMEYSGLKNIYLNATMMNISHEEIEKKIPYILEFADIGEYINQPVKTYSSGMFVRLAFAVAINVNPDILIVDEALAVGDARFQMKCLDKFLEFVKEGKTILFVSHDINAVKRFCSRVIWLEKGKKVMDGNTDEVTDRYQDYLISDKPFEEYASNNTISDIDDEAESVAEDVSEQMMEGVEIAKICELEICGSSGEKIEEIVHGSKVRLKLRYYVKDTSIEDPLIGVAIRRIDDEYICGINTKLDNKKVLWKKGMNEIELVYNDFALVGGEYYFDMGIFDHTGMVNIDYRTKIKSFFVKMDYIAEGIVVLRHDWNVRK